MDVEGYNKHTSFNETTTRDALSAFQELWSFNHTDTEHVLQHEEDNAYVTANDTVVSIHYNPVVRDSETAYGNLWDWAASQAIYEATRFNQSFIDLDRMLTDTERSSYNDNMRHL